MADDKYRAFVEAGKNTRFGAPGSKRCGAKLRNSDKRCQRPAMANGRCRLHGGLSSGAKTRLGKARSREGSRLGNLRSLVTNLLKERDSLEARGQGPAIVAAAHARYLRAVGDLGIYEAERPALLAEIDRQAETDERLAKLATWSPTATED